MTRFELRWGTKDNEVIRTSCPTMAETAFRSTSGFSKRPIEVQKAFDDLYGEQRGEFEQVLRTAADTDQQTVDTRIRGLTVTIHRSQNQVVDLSDRPNHSA